MAHYVRFLYRCLPTPLLSMFFVKCRCFGTTDLADSEHQIDVYFHITLSSVFRSSADVFFSCNISCYEC